MYFEKELDFRYRVNRTSKNLFVNYYYYIILCSFNRIFIFHNKKKYVSIFFCGPRSLLAK